MVEGVELHSMVKLPDGTLLSVGGTDASNTPTDIIQAYDAESQTWTLRSETMIQAKVGVNILVPDDWCNPNGI